MQICAHFMSDSNLNLSTAVFRGQILPKLRIVLIPKYLLRILISCCYIGVSIEVKSAMPITASQLDTTASIQDDLAYLNLMNF